MVFIQICIDTKKNPVLNDFSHYKSLQIRWIKIWKIFVTPIFKL